MYTSNPLDMLGLFFFSKIKTINYLINLTQRQYTIKYSQRVEKTDQCIINPIKEQILN